MKRWVKIIFILFIGIQGLYASHLMGGHLGYEYLGLQPNGKYLYKIKLVTYVDCSPASEIPYAEYPLKVGVYANNLLDPGADKAVVDSLLLYKIDTTVYIPYLPPGCVIGANTCIIETHYSGTIELASSINGYYLFYERCCRNDAILNLQPDGSDGFLAYIPPTSVVNSTPDFLYPPIPFLCINDTTVILNTATDADGDSLVYSFTAPYNAFGSIWDPLPHLPAPAITWPLQPVDYVNGFNALNPFGVFGSATINTHDGVSTYFNSMMGTFVVGVLVREYRNGALVSETIRDLQLLFNNCPNNDPPQLVQNLQHQYTLHQGDSLCFPVTFRDPENDSVFLEAHGEVFDTSVFNPPASFQVTQVDSNQTSADFCWTPPCDIDTGMYTFFVKALDNGCPPKDKYEFYTIRIVPPEAITLLGSDSACKNTDSVLYHVVTDHHYVYDWDLLNGNILHNYGDSVAVSWENADSGYIHVNVFTMAGCYIGSDSMRVTLIDIPVLTAMPDDTVCMKDTLLLTATGTDPYYWYPENALLSPSQGDNLAIISGSGWFYVAGLPSHLCPPSDSVFITTLPLPQLHAYTNDSSVCSGDTIELFSSPGFMNHWEPELWVEYPDSVNSPAIAFEPGMYIVSGIDSNNCRNKDTVEIRVHPIPVLILSAIDQLCDGDTASITASGGLYYHWWPGNFMLPDTGSTVAVFPGMNTTYQLEITDSNGCVSDTSFEVTVNDLPVAQFSYDTLSVGCEGAMLYFTNLSSGAQSSHWNFGNGSSSSDMNAGSLFPFGNTYIVQLTVTNAAQCSVTYTDTVSTDSLQSLVHIKPVNIFTPDENGKNDLLDFHIPGEFLGCCQIFVYDRWGVLMYESLSGGGNWDGKVGGKYVPEGIYFWVVRLNGFDFNGFVHIHK